ncbi:hypothetical protein Adt_11534 [Abeliophyllum distichum]|uniref:Uncharacterized protein n=1 Tax=Abeliophyllum distichum TaxID=126358 RepID=A0ABD1UNB6_9LAMI
MDKDDHDKDYAPLPSHPSDVSSSHFRSSSTFSFSFSEDYYNLLNGRINSLTSTVDDLQNMVGGLQQSVDGLTSLLQQVLALQQALNSQFDMMFHSSPPPEK